MAMDWKKSSRCESGTCVEVAVGGGRFGVRDSKNPGAELWFTGDEWADFIAGARDGEFGPLSAV